MIINNDKLDFKFQVEFLEKIQRILGEGSFVSSYKFALLQALADISVLKGDDSLSCTTIKTSEIAYIFVRLYQRQCKTFKVNENSEGFVLQQSTGKQAGIIRIISDDQKFKKKNSYKPSKKTLSEIEQIIKIMPLWKLQRVGKQEINFLYKNLGKGNEITLKPGVAYCFRIFHGLISQLIRSAWINFVQKINCKKLEGNFDLNLFLFGFERENMSKFKQLLIDVQGNKCLYCDRKIQSNKIIHIDHFIPWSKFPTNIGANLVLAHKNCNEYKSNFLASEIHLSKWKARNKNVEDNCKNKFDEVNIKFGFSKSLSIAKWAYGLTEKINGQVWQEGKKLEVLSGNWKAILNS